MAEGTETKRQVTGLGALATYHGQSDANSALAFTTPDDKSPREILAVAWHFSTDVSVDVSVQLLPAQGAAYNTFLYENSLSAEDDDTWQPTFPWPLMPGDVIEVKAAAAGAGETSQIIVYTREIP